MEKLKWGRGRGNVRGEGEGMSEVSGRQLATLHIVVMETPL